MALKLLAAKRPASLVHLTALADCDPLTWVLPTTPAAYPAQPVNVAKPRLGQHIFLKHTYRFVRLALAGMVWLGAEAACIMVQLI